MLETTLIHLAKIICLIAEDDTQSPTTQSLRSSVFEPVLELDCAFMLHGAKVLDRDPFVTAAAETVLDYDGGR